MSLKENVLKYLESSRYAAKRPDGWYEVEIYADYQDKIDYETVEQLCESNDPMQTFSEKMFEWYGDAENDIVGDMVDEIMREFEDDDSKPDWYEVREELFEHLTVAYPHKHFLKQEICVNIMVDTGDGDYDYTLNAISPSWHGNMYNKNSIDNKASLLWLTKQQGHTKTELKDYLFNDDSTTASELIKSIQKELVNMSSHMSVLTFLARMPLEDLLRLNELVKLTEQNGVCYDTTELPYCGYIIIDKKAECGLFDPWSGCGSVLEIELEKDVRLPVRFIRSALPDGCDGYAISEVYGTNSSIWREDTVKEIHEPRSKEMYVFKDTTGRENPSDYISDADGVAIVFSSKKEGIEALRKANKGIMPEAVKYLRSVGKCTRCGHPLFRSEIKGYSYQCFNCDEDFYKFEQKGTRK